MADEILTGEGVALQVSAASVLARAGAWLIDALVTGVVVLGLPTVLISVIGADRFDEALARAILYALIVAVFLIAPITVETLTHGRSLGKVAFGLQVLRDDGGPIRLRHASVRALVGVFELWLLVGGLAFVTSMLNDRGKRVGDYLAGTYVVRMRGVRGTVPPLWLPPELAAWAQLTDIRPLPGGLALRARLFLSRAHEFPPPVRYRNALRLAAQLEEFVAPAPPPGTHPNGSSPRSCSSGGVGSRTRSRARGPGWTPSWPVSRTCPTGSPTRSPDPGPDRGRFLIRSARRVDGGHRPTGGLGTVLPWRSRCWIRPNNASSAACSRSSAPSRRATPSA